jgi:hypothetical protein
MAASRATVPPLPGSRGGARSPTATMRRSPSVYPALLSRVAEAFRDRIALGERVKDGLAYKDAFDGREAVDKIAYIIKTTDRNLALLLGRALDAQKFFHDVSYEHRLRDNPNELYQFRTRIPSPFASIEEVHNQSSTPLSPVSSNQTGTQAQSGMATITDRTIIPSVIPPDDSPGSIVPIQRPRGSSITGAEIPLPSGVFTLLTDCYSPTCSRDQLCYSIACPRRLEQQARLNLKPQPGLRRTISRESLGDLGVCFVVIMVCLYLHPDNNLALGQGAWDTLDSLCSARGHR